MPTTFSGKDETERDSSDMFGAHCPVLVTERLVLRAPHRDDVETMAELANNPAIAAMLTRMPHPYGRHDARSFVERAANPEPGKCTYAMTLGDTGAFIGCCGIEPQEDPAGLKLGYWVGQPYWGHGYASEAAQAVIDMAFRTRAIDHVDAGCRVINQRSRRVIEKCGFRYRAHDVLFSRASGKPITMEEYRLDRERWLSLKTATAAS